MDCLVCEMFGVWDVFGVGCLMSGFFFCLVVWFGVYGGLFCGVCCAVAPLLADPFTCNSTTRHNF